ncbi:3beta-hydroxysteroid-dehydrogenase/decarboxylase isoform 2 [Artemisia annua]|uniref:3beta-hydroxysteroid-dehydrogenase/decarboxylase isoform 2 n=1 Tax=Artemisia annua TaxID=35608 RepID=A0A2U1M521_ARTAN|nr:3beta-hydroxysteroid-dehydrogenase/decarboxylase isoform 2 [Artemisia annua]
MRGGVVTGGRGFAARHLVEMLIRYEIYSVQIADSGPEIKLEPHEEKGSLGTNGAFGKAIYKRGAACIRLQQACGVDGIKPLVPFEDLRDTTHSNKEPKALQAACQK